MGESSSGRGGTIQLTAPLITLNQGAEVAVNSQGVGRSGNLEVVANTLTLDQGQLTAETRRSAGGTIRLTLQDQLQMGEQSSISAATRNGQSGQVLINADQAPVGAIALTGQSRIATEAQGNGNGDRLVIHARQVSLADQSTITASTTVGQGGDVVLRGLDTLSMQSQSSIGAATETGQAGSLRITAAEAIALNNGSVLSVEANPPDASPLAQTQTATAIAPIGIAGNLTLRTRDLTVTDGSRVTVSSPRGEAGNLDIAAQFMQLNNGALTAVTGTSGGDNSAVITLDDLVLLTMQNRSLISAEALNQANGGNITINADGTNAIGGFVVGVPDQDNDIIARANEGQGGNIQITAQSILGFEERIAVPGNGTNDIDASSQFGAPGVVTLNQPDVDPNRGTAVLPSTLVDASQQIAQTCPSGAASESIGSFVITGRGGLPPNPGALLSGENVMAGWIMPDAESLSQSADISRSTSRPVAAHIIEAQHWQRGANGDVMLVALMPESPDVGYMQLRECPAP